MINISNLASLVIIFISTVLGLAIFLAFKKIQSRVSELSYQNRLLKALRSLDLVVLSTTELQPICQEIVNVIRRQLGYFFGVIAIADQQSKKLRRVAISRDPVLDEILANLPVRFQDQAVPFNMTDNLLIRAMLDKKVKYTTNMYDVHRGVLPKEVSQKIQEDLNIKSIYVYPLMTKDNVIGTIYYTPQVEKAKLSQFEFVIMEAFTNEVSRILENILLYQNLRETSRKLQDANQKLQELDMLKDDFVSIASHELRTPMTAIRAYSWMALNKPDIVLSEKMKKYLSRTLTSTERLINLVNDMLNVSRIESGRIEIKPEAFNIVSRVKEVMEEVNPKAMERGLKLLCLESKIPEVFADPEKVHQVLLNLVGNALKFTPQGGIITISFFTDGKAIETTVKDTGPGLTKEDLGRLFQKFGRLDNSYVAMGTSGGTGLGLFISKKLVELLHGKIWASSPGLGKGASFTFSLPIEKYQVQPVTGETKSLEPVAI